NTYRALSAANPLSAAGHRSEARFPERSDSRFRDDVPAVPGLRHHGSPPLHSPPVTTTDPDMFNAQAPMPGPSAGKAFDVFCSCPQGPCGRVDDNRARHGPRSVDDEGWSSNAYLTLRVFTHQRSAPVRISTLRRVKPP